MALRFSWVGQQRGLEFFQFGKNPAPTCRLIRLAARPLWIKAESLQYTGSVKLRGATNAVAARDDRAKSAGVIGYSAGNHGRGLASAARLAGIPATVVMPEIAPETKIRGTREEGATVILCPRQRP